MTARILSHKQFKRVSGTPKDAFKWMPNYVKMYDRCVALATARSPEAWLYGQSSSVCCVLPNGLCLVWNIVMERNKGVRGDRKQQWHCWVHLLPCWSRTTASATSCCFGFLVINSGKEGLFRSTGTTGGQRSNVQGHRIYTYIE